MVISLARVLLDSGLLDVTWLGKATAIATEANVPVAHALCRWKLIDPAALAQALAKATGLSVVDVSSVSSLAAPMQRAACHRLRVLPLRLDGNLLVLGMTDPTDDGAVKQVEQALQMKIKRQLVDDDALEEAVGRLFSAPGDGIRAPAAPASTAGFSAEGSPTIVARGPAMMQPALQAPPPTLTPPPPAAPWSPLVSKPPSISDEGPRTVANETISLSSDLFAGPSINSATNTTSATPSGVFREESEHTMAVDLPQPQPTIVITAPEPEMPPTVAGGMAFGEDEEGGPTLQNDVLSVMRVLVACDDLDLGGAVLESFGARLRELRVVQVQNAAAALERRKADVVVVVEPKNTIPGSQQVAAIAARCKGITVVTGIQDFSRLPGVRRIVAPAANATALIDTLERVFAEEARE